MSRYLITGGLGFIGSALANALTASGHKVRIIDNLSSGRRDAVNADCEVVIGDVNDATLVGEVMSGIDGCFHLGMSHESVDDFACNNLSGMINVLSAARHSQRTSPMPVVYASTSAIYGDNAHSSLREVVMARPLTIAAADRAAIELRTRVATLAHGIPTTGLRLFSIYGPGPHGVTGSHQGVVAAFLNRIRQGQSITIYGDGHQTRDFVYLEDAVMFFITAMSLTSLQPAIYNVCTGRQTSIRQLADMLCSLCGRIVDIHHEQPRKGDIRSSVGNPEHAIRHLGLRARTTLAGGLQQMLSMQPAPDRTATGNPGMLAAAAT
jgi:UDP-glucose 4-epimerase